MPIPLVTHNQTKKCHNSVHDNTLPRLGLASLPVRMGCAYMWTNVLFLLTIITIATVWMVWATHSPLWSWPLLLSTGLFFFVFFLLVYAPLGGLFGLLTARRLALRLRSLANATIKLANGDYHLRVPIQRKDEVGILEEQFNAMAQRLDESRQREQELLAQQVLQAERTRIARELHDAVSQNLFSLNLLVGGMQSALPADSPLHTRIELFEKTTDTMTREMRALLLELRPVQLEELGLKEALEEIATAYSTRLDLTIETDITSVSLAAPLEHAILRITQEALSNAIRHAQATTITLTLALAQDQRVDLTIEDNGHGFDLQSEDNRYGLGLRLMRERVQELNGDISIQSQPEMGTCIHISFSQEEAA